MLTGHCEVFASCEEVWNEILKKRHTRYVMNLQRKPSSLRFTEKRAEKNILENLDYSEFGIVKQLHIGNSLRCEGAER